MLTAVVARTGALLEVSLPGGLLAAEEGEAIKVPENDLNPIALEVKEMLWGFGAFVVLALLMRFVLFPRLKKGMDARYGSIRADHEAAEALRADARSEVASYEAALAEVRSEAAARIDAARQMLEAERAEQLAMVNERIAQRKAAAAAEIEAARAAAQAQVHAAVSEVTAQAVERALGRRPASELVQRAVDEVMSAEVLR